MRPRALLIWTPTAFTAADQFGRLLRKQMQVGHKRHRLSRRRSLVTFERLSFLTPSNVCCILDIMGQWRGGVRILAIDGSFRLLVFHHSLPLGPFRNVRRRRRKIFAKWAYRFTTQFYRYSTNRNLHTGEFWRERASEQANCHV